MLFRIEQLAEQATGLVLWEQHDGSALRSNEPAKIMSPTECPRRPTGWGHGS
ncbi:hypothetical protein Fuma_05026 [Fuerstiella marisgermanici]|uniref:Uncharacterized protein n=1 Tax=Fuerstiella marisgermanici TaxID=1891926 RepID=A0A1P8WMV0_9PLAN|nr:hypothetical protein Fuma_05026 [Fuerstiella marisgermanici]